MSEQAAPEPTMEEILASIRRIISEDDAPATEAASDELEAAEPAEGDDDVLELTERIELEAAAPEPLPSTAPMERPAVSAPTWSEPEAPPPLRRDFEDIPKRQPEAPRMHDDDDRLVSDQSAAVAASAFGRLTAAVSMPEPGRTLEDVTKELLKPILRAWLDENLPRIVEAKVAEEVERVSRGRVR